MSIKVPISSRSAVTVCFAALRNMALSLEKSFSIGFKSGESGDKYTNACTNLGQCLFGPFDLMTGQMVGDHNIPLLQIPT